MLFVGTSPQALAANLTIDDFTPGADSTAGVIVNRQPGATDRVGRKVPLSGQGLVGNSLEGMCNYVGGEPALSWAPLEAVTVSNDRWTGTLNLPLSKDWLRCRVRANGSTSPFQKVKWGVGINWLWIGQSNFNRAYQILPVTIQSSPRVQVYTAIGWHSLDTAMPGWDSDSPFNDNARIFGNVLSKRCDCLVGILPFAIPGTYIQQWIDRPNDGSNVWHNQVNIDGDGMPQPFKASPGRPGFIDVESPNLQVGQLAGFVNMDRAMQSRSVRVNAVANNSVGMTVAITGEPLDTNWIKAGQVMSATGLSSPNLVDHDFEGAIWQQGENDAGMGVDQYLDRLTQLWHQVVNVTHRQPQQFAFGIVPMGTSFGGGAPDPNAQPYFEGVRQAQMRFVDANPKGVFFAGSLIDSTHIGGDGIHAGPQDYAHFFKRLTQGALHASGLADHGGAGPRVASARMATGSNVVVVNIAHDGGTKLQDASGNSSASGLRGFRVFKNGSGCPVAGASITGPSQVSLEVQCTRSPTDKVNVDYGYGDNPGALRAGSDTNAHLVYDDFAPLFGTPYADTIGTPLQPTRSQLMADP